MEKSYQVCCQCGDRFPPLQSLGFADNKCVKCSGPVVRLPANIPNEPFITSTDLIGQLSRSRLVSHKEPEGRDESPPPGQEDEHRLERHPNTAGFPVPTDTVEITEEALSEEPDQLPPEALEASAP